MTKEEKTLQEEIEELKSKLSKAKDALMFVILNTEHNGVIDDGCDVCDKIGRAFKEIE